MPKISLQYYGRIETTPFKAPVWNPLDEGEYVFPQKEAIDPSNIAEIEAAVTPAILKAGGTRIECSDNRIRGFEVGDDRVDLSFSTVSLGRALVLQERIFKMKTSWKDTYISNRDFNFCEVTTMIPRSTYGDISYARKQGTTGYLDFIDAPVLRLVLDVSKSDKSHSSTTVGKSAMLGRRMLTPHPRASMYLHIACWLQDGHLNTVKSPEPKYLTTLAGGSGVPPLYGDPLNTFLYLKAYKGGTYSRVYGSALNELRIAVRDLHEGKPAATILCSRLRQKQDYLHATYQGSVLIPPKPALEGSGDVIRPLIYGLGTTASLRSAERRLLSTRRVITRRDAEIELARTKRLTELLFGYETVPRQERIDRDKIAESAKAYGGAFRANAAVKALLDRTATGEEAVTLIEEGFLDPGCGVLDLSENDVAWICAGGKGETFNADDVGQSEDLFLRTEVSDEETMRISGITLHPRLGTGVSTSVTRAEIGIYQYRESTDQWASEVINDLIGIREYVERPGAREMLSVLQKRVEFISDDPVIHEAIVRDTEGMSPISVAVVTADLKQCRNHARMTGHEIMVVHPELLIALAKKEYWTDEPIDSQVEASVLSLLKGEGRTKPPQFMYVDYGSLSHFAQNLTRDEGDPEKIFRTTKIEAHARPWGREVTLYQKEVNPNPRLRVRVISPNQQEIMLTLGESEPDETGQLQVRSRRIARFEYKARSVLSSLSKNWRRGSGKS